MKTMNNNVKQLRYSRVLHYHEVVAILHRLPSRYKVSSFYANWIALDHRPLRVHRPYIYAETRACRVPVVYSHTHAHSSRWLLFPLIHGRQTAPHTSSIIITLPGWVEVSSEWKAAIIFHDYNSIAILHLSISSCNTSTVYLFIRINAQVIGGRIITDISGMSAAFHISKVLQAWKMQWTACKTAIEARPRNVMSNPSSC